MPDPTPLLYDALAAHYHLLFDNWSAAIERQAHVLGRLIASRTQRHPLRILDCACGIGTQALGFASMGHAVVASDVSPAAIQRARSEASLRSLDLSFHVADMASLESVPGAPFDMIAALDNALPHLTRLQLARAASAIARRLKPGGFFLASIRDYDTLLQERPALPSPAFFGEEGSRRIVHQLWDWFPPTSYVLHLYITLQSSTAESRDGWQCLHFASTYRALRRAELSAILTGAGFSAVDWLMPADTGFYQPIVIATLPS